MIRTLRIQYVLSIFLICTVASGFGQTKEEKKEERQEIANAAYTNTKNLIDSGNFVFRADRAFPAGSGSISMVNNPHQVLFKGNNVEVYLPYFGVVRAGGGYNAESVINYDGAMDQFSVSHNDKKRRSTIKFKVRSGTERHEFTININKSRYTQMIVTSSARNSISYHGYIYTPDDPQ